MLQFTLVFFSKLQKYLFEVAIDIRMYRIVLHRAVLTVSLFIIVLI